VAQLVLNKLFMPQGDSLFQLIGEKSGLNNKLKLTTRRSYGFRTFRAAEIALYHTLGNLPERECAHEFY
jgi:hypothetical protein